MVPRVLTSSTRCSGFRAAKHHPPRPHRRQLHLRRRLRLRLLRRPRLHRLQRRRRLRPVRVAQLPEELTITKGLAPAVAPGASRFRLEAHQPGSIYTGKRDSGRPHLTREHCSGSTGDFKGMQPSDRRHRRVETATPDFSGGGPTRCRPPDRSNPAR